MLNLKKVCLAACLLICFSINGCYSRINRDININTPPNVTRHPDVKIFSDDSANKSVNRGIKVLRDNGVYSVREGKSFFSVFVPKNSIEGIWITWTQSGNKITLSTYDQKNMIVYISDEDIEAIVSSLPAEFRYFLKRAIESIQTMAVKYII